LPAIPSKFVSKEGLLIDSSVDEWVLSTASAIRRINFAKIKHEGLRYACKRYVMQRIRTISTNEGVAFSNAFFSLLIPILPREMGTDLRSALVKAIAELVDRLRQDQRLFNAYRLIRWYAWSARRLPDLGFDRDFAEELEKIKIPAEVKGELVRSNDSSQGPLDRTFELPFLLRALERDQSDHYLHIRQRAVVALCVALGRNGANLVHLDESDLEDLTKGVEGVPSCYVLHVPRIKKGLDSPRDDMRTVPISTHLASYIKDLIRANPAESPSVPTDQGDVRLNFRPLIRARGRYLQVPSHVASRAARLDASQIKVILAAFVKRMCIVSPVTGELLNLNPRRLRYTIGSGLAEEGISRRELAEILDHSDLQHVGVYYELRHRIVQHLDAAVARQFGTLLKLFSGKVIERPGDHPNGKEAEKHLLVVNELNPADQVEVGVCGRSSLCHLDPPFSCYLCAKFRPVRSADHAKVLEWLIESRDRRLAKYEDKRLGVQLDDVILAVGEVVELCSQTVAEHG
jgi:integrase